MRKKIKMYILWKNIKNKFLLFIYLHSLKESVIHSFCHVSIQGDNNSSFKQFRRVIGPLKNKCVVENSAIAWRRIWPFSRRLICTICKKNDYQFVIVRFLANSYICVLYNYSYIFIFFLLRNMWTAMVTRWMFIKYKIVS